MNGEAPPPAQSSGGPLRDDAPLEALLRGRRRNRVKIVKRPTVQVVLEMTPEEIIEIKEWLESKRSDDTGRYYDSGPRVELPRPLVDLLKNVTE